MGLDRIMVAVGIVKVALDLILGSSAYYVGEDKLGMLFLAYAIADTAAVWMLP